MFVDEHLAERCLCLLFSWGSGLRVTADQRTTDGDSAFEPFGFARDVFGLFIIFMVANTSDGCR